MSLIMPIRTMIVGCGAASHKLYQKPLSRLEKQGVLRVSTLLDRNAANPTSLRRFFPRPVVFEDLRRALESGLSNLSLILSPAKMHAEQSALALWHNNHVLCEKPMAATEAQCDAVIAAAIESRRVFAVGMIRRFFPAL